MGLKGLFFFFWLFISNFEIDTATDGHLEKLKVDQCKVYLRKYGLRLTGNKSILLERIREHLEVINGGGEKKYPASSFVLNCKGDACAGDVVMFEQKVYDMFSIASRSATGPPIGTRIVAGHIVKESYGAAKQQHTFTIEVLWSKGEKALPPLHPLLIKGRNLYRLQTVRQRWANEEERKKALQEKHQRGSIARCSREIRIEKKEMRKMGIRIAENKGKQQHVNPIQTKIALPESIQHPTQLQNLQKDTKRNCARNFQSKSDIAEQHSNRMTDNKGKQQPANQTQNKTFQQENIRLPQQIQNHQKDMVLIAGQHSSSFQVSKQHESEFKPDVDNHRVLKPWNYELKSHPVSHLHENPSIGAQAWSYGFQNPPRPQLHDNPQPYQPHSHWSSPHNFHHWEHQPNTNHCKRSPPRQQEYVQPRQRCRFYRQGRCYYGDHCKYLHD